MIPHEKQTLRTRMRAVLAGFSAKAGASQLIAQTLRQLPAWADAKVVYGFSPLPSEPDWRTGFAEPEKKVAFPRVVGDAMLFFLAEKFERGPLGAWEPVGEVLAPPADLILVPGVAFDPTRHRLGRGKGFYDRWLAERGSAQAIGLAFDCQIVPSVPREAHDARLDVVITETRVF